MLGKGQVTPKILFSLLKGAFSTDSVGTVFGTIISMLGKLERRENYDTQNNFLANGDVLFAFPCC